MSVFNHDIAGLVQRLDRVQEELQHSVSAGSSEYNAFDHDRMKSYLGAFTTYLNWIIAQPQLDLPETHPREIAISGEPEIRLQENESINDIARIVSIQRGEIVNSQSARKPSGLISFDERRCRALIAKLESFLESYVAVATPLDLPESSPKSEMPAAGRKGV